ncbi:DUF2690 domain-containing protein [Streptomyces sp. NPDC058739]|uniref:helix-turn-helix domain-containing protein n=1 Tax=Streptomyces sp. NPDC058739 TaxID=3346618 RepID=UPI0036BE4665
MPRWKALPDELDPQIREFTSQLRRLVDRSGLSVAAVSDRTGYSKTSWERYLNGRLLAPKGAIVALAEVTGTNPVHLTTMWELAERAWSRSEMRHDMTMEAIRISQARAALSEFGPQPGGAGRSGPSRPSGAGRPTATPGVPVQPSGADADVRDAVPPHAGGPSDDEASSVNSWNIAGYRGPSPSGRRPGEGPAGPSAPAAPSGAHAARPAGTFGAPPSGPRTGGRGKSGRRTPMLLAGVVGVVVVLVGAYLFTNRDGDKKNEGGTKPSPTVTKEPVLPPGVDCLGETCTGKDAEAMGCSGDLVTTAATATVGTTVVEVRYSETCQTAWGRITAAAPGDEVKVTAGKATETGDITQAGDTSAYTPMVAVKDAGDAVACVTLAAGTTGCTD